MKQSKKGKHSHKKVPTRRKKNNLNPPKLKCTSLSLDEIKKGGHFQGRFYHQAEHDLRKFPNAVINCVDKAGKVTKPKLDLTPECKKKWERC